MPPKTVRIDIEPNIITEGSKATPMVISNGALKKQLETIVEVEKKPMEAEEIVPLKDEDDKALLTPKFSNPLSEKDDGSEDAEFEHAFLICCWRRPIMKSARTVCYLSIISFIMNFLSLIFAGSQTHLHLAIEVVVLILELFCLLLLFYALTHDAARCMKPYLIFGTLWNIFLTILWLFCLAELLKGSYFPFRVSTALSQAFLPSNNYYHYRRPLESKESILTTVSVFVGLGGTILINFWFLHIIVLAYFYIQKKKAASRQQPTYQSYQSPWSPTATISSNNSPVSKQLPNGNTVFL